MHGLRVSTNSHQGRGDVPFLWYFLDSVPYLSRTRTGCICRDAFIISIFYTHYTAEACSTSTVTDSNKQRTNLSL